MSRAEDLRAELLRAEHLKAEALWEESSDGSRFALHNLTRESPPTLKLPQQQLCVELFQKED